MLTQLALWPSVLPRILSAAGVGLLAALPSMGFQGPASVSPDQVGAPNDLQSTVIVIETSAGALTLFSGYGKTLQRLVPDVLEESAERRRLRTYYAPHVHFHQNRMLCVRCEETWSRAPKHEGTDLLEMTCAVVEVSLPDLHERVVVAGDPKRPLASPVYSPDGQTFAVLEGESISIRDVVDGHVVATISGVLAGRNSRNNTYAQLLYVQSDELYIRWSADGATIFCIGPQNAPEDTLLNMAEGGDGPSEHRDVPLPLTPFGQTGIVEADTRSNTIRPDNIYLPWFSAGRYAGRYVQILDKHWTWVDGPLPNSEAVRALFGSQVHPALKPNFSPAQRFYFYILYEEGWFWKNALVRVDTDTGEVKNIKTLARGLYRE